MSGPAAAVQDEPPVVNAAAVEATLGLEYYIGANVECLLTEPNFVTAAKTKQNPSYMFSSHEVLLQRVRSRHISTV